MYDVVFQVATVGLGFGLLIGGIFGFTGWMMTLSFKLLNNYIK